MTHGSHRHWTTRRMVTTRRCVLVGTATISLNCSLVACSSPVIIQNFKLTAEDEYVLGFAVGQLMEAYPTSHFHNGGGFRFNAFAIPMPKGGRAYVIPRTNSGTTGTNSEDDGTIHSGWGLYRVFVKAGAVQWKQSIPKEYAAAYGIGKVRLDEIRASRARVPIPVNSAPAVIAFHNEADQYTLYEVVTNSSRGKPLELVVRFFIEPTTSKMTPGLEAYLPWVKTFKQTSENSGLVLGNPFGDTRGPWVDAVGIRHLATQPEKRGF
jgi:hypothetical protein